MRLLNNSFFWVILFVTSQITIEVQATETPQSEKSEIVLGINTADVREDTSSVQFLNLFRTAIPFSETVPWGSSKKIKYDKYGWPKDLKGGQAGTKFLNRLPENTVEDGFFTVLYDGEGTMFYGNDARLVVHRPNKDIIEIRSGKDKILNASLFIKKSNPENYVRNIRILPEGGICKGVAHIRVKSPEDCASSEYLSFEDNHFNPWAEEQREKQEKPQEDASTESKGDEKASDKKQSPSTSSEEKRTTESTTESVTEENKKAEEEKDTKEQTETADKESSTKEKLVVKGQSEISKALLFNPEYLNFMKDFQMVRYMNMSGMTRDPVSKWSKRNTLKKATWGGKYGSRGAPVEVMVALSNQINAHPWFSMPYKASDDYIQQFGEYVSAELKPELRSYIEYSNEVWNPIFIHHDYAIAQGRKAGLDKKKSRAGYKWYSKRSVETFKIWEKSFGGTERLIRVMGSWASNQIMSNTVLSYKNAYKHTDAIAIGPYVSAHPRVLRRAKTVDDVFKAMLNKKTKWGMRSTVDYIRKQAKVAKSFDVDLVAYEGGQHLVDWNTRKAEDHPNPLLYAANRDPRMGIIYDELMREWHRAGGKLFVAFSAPRIYSWYGSWGIKEHIRQSRTDAPKYDSLLRYLNTRLYPKQLPKPGVNPKELASMAGVVAEILIAYAKNPQMIWDMRRPQSIQSDLKDNNPRDISAEWQANWDSKNLYISFAINDDDLQKGDEIALTLDTTSEAEDLAKEKQQEEQDIEIEKKLLAKKKKEKTARKLKYEAIAKAKKEKEEDAENAVEKKSEKDVDTAEPTDKEVVKKEEKADGKNRDSVNDDSKKVISDKKDSDTEESEKKTTEKSKTKESKSKKEAREPEPKSDAEKAIENAFKKALKGKDKKADEVVEQSNDDKNKNASNENSEKKNDSKQSDKVEAIETEETAEKDSEKETINENVQTFIFTPFDELNSQSRITFTDSGYLLNVVIPWSEIYKNKKKLTSMANTGDKLGINIVVSDSDKDEKGNKELHSADTNLPLPKIVLKNSLVE